ncbi:nuclease-related domain-containing protein [Nostoc sp. 106C]|uniref:nuclease-related domain-containing protein n=1 Tax=Nostoc sp. 106C TaxID=1932667 RepID=UPI000A3AD99B|nr:nuclease-related domain-containing protein [Nostoc sp. 106C]OUL28862.1 nuclease [Nostoc sp. 106C]
MSKLHRQAGKNIRDLAVKRRLKAICSFLCAGLVVLFPFFLVAIFQNFLNQVSSLNSSKAQAPTLQLPILLYVLFIFLALGLVLNGIYFWRKANLADQGAKGEEDTAQALIQLEVEGWQIEYGMLLKDGLGDADIVCVSPQSQAYVVDVKSHRGEVVTDGKYLFRRMGNTTHNFEKDFLERAMKQALQVKKQSKFNFVTPIIAFSQAKVSVPSRKIRGVYVVEKSSLLSFLKSLG